MKTRHKFLVIVLMVVVVMVVLSPAAGDKPEELDKYGSVEIAFGLLFITVPFWFPLAFALLMMPGRVR